MNAQLSSRHRRRRHLHRFRDRRSSDRRHEAFQVALHPGQSDPGDRERPEADCRRSRPQRPRTIVSNCDLCINGTTVGLNALITHRGGKTGLICTAGHEDSIEIRNGHKEDGFRYDPEYPAAVMLAPRYLRRGVRERVISDGSVRTPLHEEDVRAACELFKAEGVETVAISFVWSVLNPAHERRAAEIVREMLPEAILTVGSELYPQIREYTRTSTAVGERLSGAGDAQIRRCGRCLFQVARRPTTRALFPIERRSRHRPGDDRPLGLRDQFRARRLRRRPASTSARRSKRTMSSPSTWAAPPSTSR